MLFTSEDEAATAKLEVEALEGELVEEILVIDATSHRSTKTHFCTEIY